MATFPLFEISAISATPPTPSPQVHCPEPVYHSADDIGRRTNGREWKNIRISKSSERGSRMWNLLNETIWQASEFSRRTRAFFHVRTPLKRETAKDGYKKLIKVNCKSICMKILLQCLQNTTIHCWTYETVDKHPRGYPRTAVYVNSDDTTALFRRFGDMHARLLLYKQAELTELEEKLAKIDQEDSQDPAARWKVGHSIHIKGGKRNEIRRDLILEINEKLKEYGKSWHMLALLETSMSLLVFRSTSSPRRSTAWTAPNLQQGFSRTSSNGSTLRIVLVRANKITFTINTTSLLFRNMKTTDWMINSFIF